MLVRLITRMPEPLQGCCSWPEDDSYWYWDQRSRSMSQWPLTQTVVRYSIYVAWQTSIVIPYSGVSKYIYPVIT